VSPDSALSVLQERVARLEQRADDILERVLERFGTLQAAIKEGRSESQTDLAAFGPMLRDHSDMRADMRHMRDKVDNALAKIEALDKRLDEEREQRLSGQRERREELVIAREERDVEIARMKADAEKQYNELQARAAQQRLENRRLVFGLAGIFLTAAAGVAAQILGAGGG
jgi:chromosome segregation ATPase